MSYNWPDGVVPCPTCGSPVKVVSSDEGTSYYKLVDVGVAWTMQHTRELAALKKRGKKKEP